MKLGKCTVLSLMYFAMLPATAQTYSNSAQTYSNQSTQDIAKYIRNWASNLGYNLNDKAPGELNTLLLNYPQASLLETYLFNTFFGSIPTVTPPNTSSSGNDSVAIGAPFVPSSAPGAQFINNSSNLTFKSYRGNSQQSSGGLTANPLTDQQPFQSDPVNQAILNILGTPDVSYCTNSDGKVSNPTNPNVTDGSSQAQCDIGKTMFQNQIIENVVGTLPSADTFYTAATNSTLLPQLNSNALIAPLNYNTTAQEQAANPNSQDVPGLTAQNQAEQAANFIRYVSGSVVPTILPNRETYSALSSQAKDNTNPKAQADAQALLSSYLTSLRVYAAQTSVGMGNLYYILSRRLPQQASNNNGGSGSGQSNTPLPSQALNEYNMATWRIFSPSASGDQSQNKTQWMESLNKATPATVQKEIAILLSEINYQLYLDRQIQERLLLTQSVSMLQGTKAGQPNSDLTNQTTKAPIPNTSSMQQPQE